MPTTLLTLHWGALAMRGALAILVGLIAFFMPTATLFAVTILFGAYALIAGVVSLAAAFHSMRHGQHWWQFLIEGIAGLVAAAITAMRPAVTLALLIYIIAAWALVTGIMQIAAAIRLRRHISGEWLLALSGAASIIFGVLLFAAPATGAVVLALWMGAYIFIFGVIMLSLAFRMRHRNMATLHPSHA